MIQQKVAPARARVAPPKVPMGAAQTGAQIGKAPAGANQGGQGFRAKTAPVPGPTPQPNPAAAGPPSVGQATAAQGNQTSKLSAAISGQHGGQGANINPNTGRPFGQAPPGATAADPWEATGPAPAPTLNPNIGASLPGGYTEAGRWGTPTAPQQNINPNPAMPGLNAAIRGNPNAGSAAPAPSSQVLGAAPASMTDQQTQQRADAGQFLDSRAGADPRFNSLPGFAQMTPQQQALLRMRGFDNASQLLGGA